MTARRGSRLVPSPAAIVLLGCIAATPLVAQQQGAPPPGQPPAAAPPTTTPPPAASPTPASPAAPKPGTATARVTYITAASLYFDAGRLDGLHEGDVVEVIRDGRTIATLRVSFLSEHRASCAIVNAAAPPVVGDLVRYVPRAASGGRATGGAAGAAAGAGATASSATAARSRGGWGGLHGRVGVRYQVVRDNSGGDNGFSQPALDLRLDGSGVGGSDFDVNVDVRARQTYRDWAGSEDEHLNQVYRLAATWHLPNTRQRLTVGRQFAPNLEAVSIFDGVVYDLDGDRWGGGFFAGTQPDAADFGVDGTVKEYGGYYTVHSLPMDARQWAVTMGLIDSYAEGDVNREWFYLQTRYRGPRLSGFLTQEVDYNRSWKVSEAGESTVAPTSTFAVLHYRLGQRFTLHAGYDNRRSIRLWQDRVTPATAFDDSHRQGGWAGGTLRFGRHFVIGADGRVVTGGPSGRADGYSGNFGWDGLSRANMSFSLRGTRYTNDRSDGWMYALAGGTDLGRRAHLELAAGRVEETSLDDPTLDRTDDWYGLDVDLLLGRSWYMILSVERYTGTFQDNDQGYAGVTYRF